MSTHLGLIGFGAIAQGLIDILCEGEGAPERITLLCRPGKEAATQQAAEAIVAGRGPGVTAVSDLEGLLAAAPDVVVECAGHSAVAAYGVEVLAAGIDLIVASIGALANDALVDGLRAAAVQSGAQVTVPSGAIGGIDALAGARLSGITEVVYTGRKPPQAWAGSPAEAVVDLSALTVELVFFEGSAREAAQAYPKNANVAATLALAGIGMDATQVRLIADPSATANTHEYAVRSNAVDYTMKLVGKPSPLNPKTSQSTVLSLARAVLNRSAAIAI